MARIGFGMVHTSSIRHRSMGMGVYRRLPHVFGGRRHLWEQTVSSSVSRAKGLDVAGHTKDKTTDSESAALTNVGAILDNNQVQTMKECKDISGGDEQCTGTVTGTREWAAAQHLIVVMEPLLQGRTNTHPDVSAISISASPPSKSLHDGVIHALVEHGLQGTMDPCEKGL